MDKSLSQIHQEDIRRKFTGIFRGWSNLFHISAQFNTGNMNYGLILCRRLKDRFLRTVHKKRSLQIPFVGSLEVKGHLHTHLLTVLPMAVGSEDVEVLMKDVFSKTKGLHKNGNHCVVPPKNDSDWWIDYITKFHDQNDEVIWL